MPPKEHEFCYDEFLDQIQYDREYARRRYPDWIMWVRELYKNERWEFAIMPLYMDNTLIDFLEFIDGNGFYVERQVVDDSLTWIDVLTSEKKK